MYQFFKTIHSLFYFFLISQLLLEFGADVNSEHRDVRRLDYQSPLSLAFAYQHLETVKLLLRSGADPDIGGHLYHQAARKKYPLIYAQLLYEFGSNIYQKDNSQAYAWEIDGGQSECAEFLRIIKGKYIELCDTESK